MSALQITVPDLKFGSCHSIIANVLKEKRGRHIGVTVEWRACQRANNETTAYPYDVDLDSDDLLDAGRNEYLLGVGGVDGRTEGRSAPVARSHSLQSLIPPFISNVRHGDRARFSRASIALVVFYGLFTNSLNRLSRPHDHDFTRQVIFVAYIRDIKFGEP